MKPVDISRVGRASGIEVVGDLSWGTHMCQLFETKKDLLEVLVPYFKAGLEGNELCIWVTTKPLEVEEARAALYREVANIDSYVAKRQIEILDYRDWYIRGGVFDPDAVLQSWAEKERLALSKGFDGIRVSGNMAWLANDNWETLVNYEMVANAVLPKYRIIAICAYPISEYGLGEIVDLVSNHRFVLLRRAGGLTNIVNDPYKCIFSFRKKGLSYAIIGSRLGLSRERVRQIVNGARRKQMKMLTTDTDADTLLSCGKTAKLLGVHINTVRRWSDQGMLPAQRIGIRCERRFKRKDIDHFLSSIASRSAAQLV